MGADIAASNGVIHGIDTVLTIPPCPTPAPNMTIVEVAATFDELSTLVTALKAADLEQALAGPTLTIFAPTNQAFERLPKATLAHLLDPANIKELVALLEYHVLPEQASAEQIIKFSKKYSVITTLEGRTVNVRTLPPNSLDETILVINDAFVTTADIRASNGFIHIIDTVLTVPKSDPKKATICDVVAANPDLSTLNTALKAAEFNYLCETSAPQDPDTFFAPSNAAFDRLPKVTLLEYHVAPGLLPNPVAYYSKDLTNGEKIPTLHVNTVTRANDYVTVTIDPSKNILINDAFATTADIGAYNGVIHIIDTVLTLPKAAKKTTICDVVAANPNLSTLNTALKATQFNYLCETSAPQYPDTLFAPSNAAFDRLPKATLAHLLDPANVDELSTLLEYHVAPGLLPNPVAYYSKDLTNGEEIPTLHINT